MNYTVDHQLEHRTIRAFKDVEVKEEVLNKIKEVAKRTATSTGLQSASVIRVVDQEKRDAIAEVCKQAYVAEAPELWIFLVDLHRNHQIAVEQDLDTDSARDMDRFFQGFSDAILMAQNTLNAVESFDLGGVFLGSIHNDDRKIIEILDLPELTFPALGLAFGEKNQSPQLKPRMDMEFRFFENQYERKESYLDLLKDYDEEMQTYYDLREANKRVDSFTKQVATQYSSPSPKRREIFETVLEQGFTLKPRP